MFVRPLHTLRGFAFAVVAFTSLSCANKPPTGGPGSYRGVLVGTSTGIVEMTVLEASSGPLPASGTIDFGSSVVSLSGTLDRSNASISLSSTDGYQLTGVSRPTYMFGWFNQGTLDAGSFALFLESADSSPIRLLCGSYVDTATATPTQYPFAVTAVPSGPALCVGRGFTWFGTLDASDNALTCESGGGLFSGNANADAGNQWGTGNDYGTWTLAPCGGGAGTDGGVDAGPPDDGANDGAID